VAKVAHGCSEHANKIKSNFIAAFRNNIAASPVFSEVMAA
jgi:hypothetical protein